jgi:hypothetical protein
MRPSVYLLAPSLAALLLAACGGPHEGKPPPSFDVPPPRDAGARPDLEPPQGVGSIWLSVLDVDTGLPIPARAIITAVAPTPPVRLDVNSQGMPADGRYGVNIAPGVIGAPEGVLLVAGSGGFQLPAGDYDLMLTHGPEWEADQRTITITRDQNLMVTASLRHSVDTTGWLAADLHVHTARSFDSRIQVEDRVVTEVAVGVEVIVATDHNVLSNLQPDVELFGYGSLARAIVGDEFNFYEGHGGAYPMPYDPADPADQYGNHLGGADEWKLDWPTVAHRPAMDMFDFLHAFSTAPAVTINHPRMLPDLGYFTNTGWAPPAPLPTVGHFDALEILNGYTDAPDEIATLLRDWFFLLSSGTRVTALGSSDTHALRDVKAGFPRTWLRMPTEDVTLLLDSDLGDAVKHQRAIASNGPFALLTVDGTGIGDQVTSISGQVMIDITVDAPPWIDVDNVRLFVNGQVAWQQAVAAGTRPILHAHFPLTLPSGDAWIALAASGSKPLPTALIGEHLGGTVTPFAITNAVFVDGDGDGAWRPAIAEPDPGPIQPSSPQRPPFWPDGSHPAPQDCEPPLWMEPSRWANP